jgi:hypothetical protein
VAVLICKTMRNFIIFILFVFCLSCQKNEPNPNDPVAKGAIEATTNGKKWPDRGDLVQVTFMNVVPEDTARSPCALPSLMNMDVTVLESGYGLSSNGFLLEKKIGTFKITQSSSVKKLDCNNLPYSSGFTYWIRADARVHTYYELDLTKDNKITISEIKDDLITGSFQVNYKKVSSLLNTEYPENIPLICTKFVAVPLAR